MAIQDQVPRVVQRQCGGWIALSKADAELKIGVCADTEESAKTKYQDAVTAWSDILSATGSGPNPPQE